MTVIVQCTYFLQIRILMVIYLDMSNTELFDAWLKWEGIIGYTDTVKLVIANIWQEQLEGGLKD